MNQTDTYASTGSDARLLVSGPCILNAVRVQSKALTSIVVKFHDLGVTPTAGSTPVAIAVAVPAALTATDCETGSINVPVPMDNGLAYTITTGIGLVTDSTAVAANDVVVTTIWD